MPLFQARESQAAWCVIIPTLTEPIRLKAQAFLESRFSFSADESRELLDHTPVIFLDELTRDEAWRISGLFSSGGLQPQISADAQLKKKCFRITWPEKTSVLLAQWFPPPSALPPLKKKNVSEAPAAVPEPEMKKHLQQLEARNRELEEGIQKHKEVMVLQQRLDESLKKIKDLETEQLKQRKESDSRERENQNWKAQAEEALRKFKKIQEEYALVVKERDRLREQNAGLDRLRVTQEKAMRVWEEKHAFLENKLQEEKKTQEAAAAEFESRADEMAAQKESLVQESKRLSAGILKLEEELREASGELYEAKTQRGALIKKIEDLEGRLEAHEKKARELENQIKASAEAFLKSEEEKKTQNAGITKLEEKLRQTGEELLQTKNQRDEFAKKAAEIEGRLEAHEKKACELENQIKASSEALLKSEEEKKTQNAGITKLEEKLRQTGEELLQTKNQRDEFAKKAAEMEGRLSANEAKTAELGRQVKAAAEENARLQDQFVRSSASLKELKDKLQKTEEALKKSGEEKNAAVKESEENKKQVSALNLTIETLKAENAGQKQGLDALREEFQRLRDEDKHQADAAAERAAKEIDAAKRQISHLEGLYQEKHREHETVLKEAQARERVIEQEKKNAEAVKKRSEEELRTFAGQKEQIRELENAYQKLLRDFEEKKREEDVLQRKLQQAQAEIHRLQASAQTALKAGESAAEVQKLQDSLSEAAREIASLKERFRHLEEVKNQFVAKLAREREKNTCSKTETVLEIEPAVAADLPKEKTTQMPGRSQTLQKEDRKSRADDSEKWRKELKIILDLTDTKDESPKPEKKPPQ